MYNQLDVEKNANAENKKKMEQKFFMEKNKMEMEVDLIGIFVKNIFSGNEKNCPICRKGSKRGDFGNVRDNAQSVQGQCGIIGCHENSPRKVGNLLETTQFFITFLTSITARTEELEAENAKLRKENRRLLNEVEINENTVKEKVTETKKAKDKILVLKGRLEDAQNQLVEVKAHSEARNELVLANVRISYMKSVVYF